MMMKALALLAALSIFEIVREHYSFRVSRYEICQEKLNGIDGRCKIVFLSDLHSQTYGKGNAKLLKAVREERPDYILIGGDMLVGKRGYDFQTALDFVRELPSLCPVYYANGNHEQRLKERPERYGDMYARYKKGLLEAGVCVLENSTAKIMEAPLPIEATGLEIPREYYGRRAKKHLKKETICSLAGPCAPFGYRILLAHNPCHMEAYFAWGADLVLSGHLHGGILRLPGIGGVISTGFKLFPKFSGGMYKRGRQTAVVSRGIGTHTIPVRLFNPAEIVVLDLRGAYTEGCGTAENLV